MGLLRECPDRLAADLRQFYGVRLSDMWAGRESIREVSDYAAHLPRGGAVGEWFGGWLAVPLEVEALWENTHALVMANAEKPKLVKPRKPPEGVKHMRQREKKAISGAAAWRRKHGK